MVFVLPIHDENRPSRRPYITYGLIVINVLVFFFFLLQEGPILDKVFYAYGAIPAYILRGERLWTLFTSMFMHGDIMHLAGNMVFLWIFGDNIEDTIGHGRYLLFYLVGGVFASFAHIASTLLSIYTTLVHYVTPDLGIPSLGASGAISAVLGAYMVLYPQSRIRTLVLLVYIVTFASIPAYYYLGFWFLYQLLMAFSSLIGTPSTVAFWAHVGGYVYGMALVKALSVEPRKRAPWIVSQEPARPVTAPWVITPLVDVLLDDDRVTVLADLPGVDERDIKVRVSEWLVEISAEYKDIEFYKQVTLPVPVIPKVHSLVYRNGMLSFALYRTV